MGKLENREYSLDQLAGMYADLKEKFEALQERYNEIMELQKTTDNTDKSDNFRLILERYESRMKELEQKMSDILELVEGVKTKTSGSWLHRFLFED